MYSYLNFGVIVYFLYSYAVIRHETNLALCLYARACCTNDQSLLVLCSTMMMSLLILQGYNWVFKGIWGM